MTGRETYLRELKAQQSRDEYFEGIRQIFDQLKDEFSLDKTMWMANTDFMDALLRFEQGYKRQTFLKGEPR